MDSILSLGITDKVSAINHIMSSIGMVGISTEDDIDYSIDASDASKLIDNISQVVQSNGGKGYWFNRENFHKLKPSEVDGKVKVPNNTLTCTIKREGDTVVPINLRGQYLFDSEKHGYDMREAARSDGFLHCRLIVNLPFDTLPATAKHAIVDQARFWMVNDKEGDVTKMNSLKEQASISMVALVSEDRGQRRQNAFNNPNIRYTMGMVGGLNNN